MRHDPVEIIPVSVTKKIKNVLRRESVIIIKPEKENENEKCYKQDKSKDT